jgi:hypothetical protein
MKAVRGGWSVMFVDKIRGMTVDRRREQHGTTVPVDWGRRIREQPRWRRKGAAA